ncbi:MAG: hypothetical protein Q9218_007378, partial [Villophora microphyllina]
MPSFVPQQNNPQVNGQVPLRNQQGTVPNAQPGPIPMPPGFHAPPFQIGQHAAPGQQVQAPIPPQLQNIVNGHLAAMNQQFATHFAAQGQQHVHQGLPQHNFQAQAQHWQPPVFSQPSFQQIVAQQQQARAAAGQHGLAQTPQPNEPASEHNEGNANDGQTQQPHQPNVNTVVREGQGPDGGSFRMVIQSTSMSRPNSGIGQRPHSQPSLHATHRPFAAATHSPFMPPPTGPAAMIGPGGPTAVVQPSDPLGIFRQRLFSLQASIAQGTAPPQAVFESMRALLNNLATQPNLASPDLMAHLRTSLDNLSVQADRLRTAHNNILSQLVANQQAASGTMPTNPPQVQEASASRPQPNQHPPQMPMPSTPVHAAPADTTSNSTPPQISQQNSAQQSRSTAPDLYLLSSPSGPHSLLVSASGAYATSLSLSLLSNTPYFAPPIANPFVFQQPLSPIPLPNNIPFSPLQQQPQPPDQNQNQNQYPGPLPFPINQNPQPQQAQAQQQPPQQQNPLAQYQNQLQQQQQQQQQNQARDLIRILLPLGGHLWLLVRLCGFVYFFTAGGGSRRAILLGIAAFVVFIANTGALRPLLRGLWDPVRRHVEGLVPLAAAPGAQNQNQNQRPENRRQQAGNANQPTAAETAALNDEANALLIRNQNNHQNPSLLRRAERAVALFLASLVPG